MLAFIEGVVVAETALGVVLENQGLGYDILTTHQTREELEIGQTAKLFVYEQIREDRHDLYGFLDQGSKQLFEFLRTVSGVGPKMALSLLSLGGLRELQLAIIEGDSKYISSAAGVGPKLAERISLELRDKLSKLHFDASGSSQKPAEVDEAAVGLQFLGLSSDEAQSALEEIDANIGTEERIKQALRRHGQPPVKRQGN